MKESKILKVLEKVPSGTKLYSTAFGNLEFESIIEAFGKKRIELMEDNRDRRIYLPDGRYRKGGEVTLYPSREMRDWDKFAWKKGDVLVGCAKKIIFDKFTDDTYSYFEGKYCLEQDPYSDYETYKSEDKGLLTKYFHIPERCIAQSYIKYIEGRLGGKLNRETLEIEKQQEFKDGETEYQFKPFEKVLCRDYKDSVWDVDFFGFKVKSETPFIYKCVGNIYKYCIPYKGNEHLLGTSKNIEEE